jgi:hypothetical protein
LQAVPHHLVPQRVGRLFRQGGAVATPRVLAVEDQVSGAVDAAEEAARHDGRRLRLHDQGRPF